MTAPISDAPRDGEDWRRSPDLMTLDHKLDVLFGPSDPATDALIAASLVLHRLPPRVLKDLRHGLVVGTATYARARHA
jgi:hypothetical protein